MTAAARGLELRGQDRTADVLARNGPRQQVGVRGTGLGYHVERTPPTIRADMRAPQRSDIQGRARRIVIHQSRLTRCDRSDEVALPQVRMCWVFTRSAKERNTSLAAQPICPAAAAVHEAVQQPVSRTFNGKPTKVVHICIAALSCSSQAHFKPHVYLSSSCQETSLELQETV
jgi:hypothetical protein